MKRRAGAMHVATTTRRNGEKLYRTHLLRRSVRQGDKVRNETLANLSHLPPQVIDLVRRALRGEEMISASGEFEAVASRRHGHVSAVRAAMRRLDFEGLLADVPPADRALLMGLVAAGVLDPQGGMPPMRLWSSTTLPDTFGVGVLDAGLREAALDRLGRCRADVENRLRSRHLAEGGWALEIPARTGSPGARRRGFIVRADAEGRPVSVDFRPPQQAAANTVALAHESQKIEIAPLGAAQILRLLESPPSRALLLDERACFEIRDAAFPGERLIVCRDSARGARRARRNATRIEATRLELLKIQARVRRGALRGRRAIARRADAVLRARAASAAFVLHIGPRKLEFRLVEESPNAAALLQGSTVLRTRLPDGLSADRIAGAYRAGLRTERAFRSFRAPARRREARIFLKLLSTYVEWHLREAWGPILKGGRSLQSELRSLETIVLQRCRARGRPEGAATFDVVTAPSPEQRRALELIEALPLAMGPSSPST